MVAFLAPSCGSEASCGLRSVCPRRPPLGAPLAARCEGSKPGICCLDSSEKYDGCHQPRDDRPLGAGAPEGCSCWCCCWCCWWRFGCADGGSREGRVGSAEGCCCCCCFCCCCCLGRAGVGSLEGWAGSPEGCCCCCCCLRRTMRGLRLEGSKEAKSACWPSWPCRSWLQFDSVAGADGADWADWADWAGWADGADWVACVAGSGEADALGLWISAGTRGYAARWTDSLPLPLPGPLPRGFAAWLGVWLGVWSAVWSAV